MVICCTNDVKLFHMRIGRHIIVVVAIFLKYVIHTMTSFYLIFHSFARLVLCFFVGSVWFSCAFCWCLSLASLEVFSLHRSWFLCPSIVFLMFELYLIIHSRCLVRSSIQISRVLTMNRVSKLSFYLSGSKEKTPRTTGLKWKDFGLVFGLESSRWEHFWLNNSSLLQEHPVIMAFPKVLLCKLPASSYDTGLM